MKSRIARAAVVVAAAFVATGQTGNWLTEVERTDVSHIIGNPKAEGTVTEFVSYTCPACGVFARQGEEVIKLGYVSTGTARFEIRHIQRNAVDTALTLAAWCGGKEKFVQNHAALMWGQPQWLPKIQGASQAQQARWLAGPKPARYRAVASDANIYPIMEGRGISRAELDRCLGDVAFADRLEAASSDDMRTLGFNSTPSFAMDGKILPEVHNWAALAPRLSERFAQKTASYGPQ